jgi:hypothetical protein
MLVTQAMYDEREKKARELKQGLEELMAEEPKDRNERGWGWESTMPDHIGDPHLFSHDQEESMRLAAMYVNRYLEGLKRWKGVSE